MRVIQTVAGLGVNSGGPSRTVTALAGYLSKRVGNVSLLTVRLKDQSIVRPPCGDVSLIVADEPRGIDRYWQSYLRTELSRLVATDTPALVHDHGVWLPFNHAVASVCRKHHGVKRLVSPRGMLEPWALKFGALKKRLALLAYQARDLASANGFHATSEAEAEGIRRLGLKQPIAVIPNAVSAPDILPARPVLNGSINTALFLSRIHPKKGLTDLVNAWARLRPSDWRLLIVGGSELGHRNEIEQLIRSLGIQQSITISDQVADTDKWAIYAGADLFVLPSYSENFGVVVAEAMLMGLPVITTKATPWAVIREAGCGWYIDTGVPSLSSALDQAFHTTPEQLVAMGRRGRELVHSRFDWVRIAGEMAEFYLWIMYGGSRPLCVYRD